MKKFFKELFYVPKHEKPTDENIIKMLFPAFVGIVMCAACLVGLTLAWFTTSVEVPTQTITVSNFDATVTVKTENAEGQTVTPSEGVYVLESGRYYVEFHPTGNGTGYCAVEISGEKYYTEPIRNEVFGFTLDVDGKAEFRFTPVWGTFSGEANVASGSVLSVSGSTEEENTEPSGPDGDPAESVAPDTAHDGNGSVVPDPDNGSGAETAPAETTAQETEAQTEPVDTTPDTTDDAPSEDTSSTDSADEPVGNEETADGEADDAANVAD